MAAAFRQLFESKRILSISLMAVMVLLAWFYLLTMTNSMRSDMDMSDMGMGMGIFNLSHDLVHRVAPSMCISSATNQPFPLDGSGLSQHAGHTLSSYGTTHYFGMPTLGQEWVAKDFFLVFVMWIVMMIAMMLPTAAPILLTYNDILSNKLPPKVVVLSVGTFISGYLVVWGAYSVLAVFVQWVLLQSGLITDMMVGANPLVNGSVLIIAGLYQWTSLKEVCLTHCRTPLQFFLSSWQPGFDGALRMGMKHGSFCVGCCWALMILMFFFGLMNLIWIAGLSLIMLLEKILPRGDLFGKGVGVLFFVWVVAMIGTHLIQ